MRRAPFLFIFFLSGFAALVYQTIWQRLLTLFSGADVFSITIVVAAFMAGLGFGSLAGGHIADRLRGRGLVVAFALCELAIAAFAVGSATIYYDWLYTRLGAQAWSRGAVAAIVFGVTLWPTFLMGMSLPLAARLVTPDPARPSRWLAVLYGWNTLGAACGSWATVLWLLPQYDLRTCVQIGAACSAACGLGALGLWATRRPGDPGETGTAIALPTVIARETTTEPAMAWRTWLSLYALAGFTALSLEILWFRIFGIALKSNSRTFGALLGIFLAGIALGALAARATRLQTDRPKRAFLLLQAAIPLVAAGLIGLLLASIGRINLMDPLTNYLGSTQPPGARTIASGMLLLLYGTVPVALMLPSTLMMGFSFGLLHRAVQTDTVHLGRRVGWLQAANIVGSTLGALLTGLVLLEWLGTSGTLRLLVLCGIPFLALVERSRAQDRRLVAGALVAVLATAWWLPAGHGFWSRWHAADPSLTIAREDATGFVLLRDDPANGGTNVLLSGYSQSWLPYGSVHTLIGALPSMTHARPERVAVIGLGSGDTVFAIGGRDSTTHVDSIEIVRPQLAALRDLEMQGRYPALGMLLADPRVAYHFTDARAYLRGHVGQYDIIEADAIPPWAAYAGNLYSIEFFRLLGECLRDDGLAVTWTPTERVRASFLQAFPYVLMFRSVAIGSRSPIPFDPARISARMEDPFTKDYFRRGAVDLERALRSTLTETPTAYGPEFDRRPYADVNLDLFPQDEFARPYVTTLPGLGPKDR